MLTLSARSRVLLGGGALCAFAGAFVLVPLRATETAGPQAATALPSPAILQEHVAAVIPRRDPFAGDATPSTPGPTSSATLPPPPPLPPIPARIGPLPPNAGAFGDEPSLSGTRVTAIVSGTRPYAVVEELGRGRLVTVGDVVDRDRVIAIDVAGIHLAHGSTLAITPSRDERAAPVPPLPAPATAPALPTPPPIPPSGGPS
jgi:hypothetical protein